MLSELAGKIWIHFCSVSLRADLHSKLNFIRCGAFTVILSKLNSLCFASFGYTMKMGVTKYGGLQQIYFRRILKCCTHLGNFVAFSGENLFDFGCGTKELKQFASGMNYIGYDIDPSLSEAETWDKVPFHTIVLNHTLMYLDKGEIHTLFTRLNSIPVLEQIVIGIGRQNILSNIGKMLLGKRSANSGTLTTYREQRELINQYFHQKESKSVFFMTDVLLVQPRKRA